MLIIDNPSVIKDRTMFSARGAGILGLSIFGTDKTYALNDDMSINLEVVEVGILQDETELFKQFMDNESFRRWLTDTVFRLTYDNPSAGTQAGA